MEILYRFKVYGGGGGLSPSSSWTNCRVEVGQKGRRISTTKRREKTLELIYKICLTRSIKKCPLTQLDAKKC